MLASLLRFSHRSHSRRIRTGVSQSQAPRRICANRWRTCCTVIAGVHFFPPPRFAHQEPGRNQAKRDMMVPSEPVSHLVLGHARLALGTLDALLDPVLGVVYPGGV